MPLAEEVSPSAYNRHGKPLNHFRRLLRIQWHDKIPDSEVLRRASILSIHTPCRLQLGRAGQLVRMSKNRLPKQMFCGELYNGMQRKAIQGQHKGHCPRYWHQQQYMGSCCPEPHSMAHRKHQWSSERGSHTTEQSGNEAGCTWKQSWNHLCLGSEHTCPTCHCVCAWALETAN